jgi:hypothetical protein
MKVIEFIELLQNIRDKNMEVVIDSCEGRYISVDPECIEIKTNEDTEVLVILL